MFESLIITKCGSPAKQAVRLEGKANIFRAIFTYGKSQNEGVLENQLQSILHYFCHLFTLLFSPDKIGLFFSFHIWLCIRPNVAPQNKN